MGSARKGIDGGVAHAPPEYLWPAMDKFYKRLYRDAGLVANQGKNQMYSPNDNYAGKPPESSIKTTKAMLPGQGGVPTEITAHGLTIWV